MRETKPESGGHPDIPGRLIADNLRFVITIAKQYQFSGIPLEDLINEGNIGLIRAARQYEDQGFSFITYAVWWIRQAIVHAISIYASTVRIPANKLKILRQIRKARNLLEQVYQREPTMEEIAGELMVDLKTVAGTLGSPLKQQLVVGNQEGEQQNSLDLLPAEDQLQDNFFYNDGVSLAITAVLKLLTKQERLVIETSFGLYGKNAVQIDDIAAGLKLTPQRIRQIKAGAIEKIKWSGTKYLALHLY
jgi:RNA polymerase primary sigma factor